MMSRAERYQVVNFIHLRYERVLAEFPNRLDVTDLDIRCLTTLCAAERFT